MQKYSFLKTAAFVILFIIIAVHVAVYHDAASSNEKDHSKEKITFSFLIAVSISVFLIGLFIQCSSVESELEFMAWMFVVLIVVLLFSLSYAIWFCIGNVGHIIAAVVFPTTLVLVLSVYPLIYDRPQVCHFHIL